jgi:hypothetical protein
VAVTDMPFITSTQVGAFLRQDLEGDLLTEMAVDIACSAVRDACDQRLDAVVADVVTIDGPGTEALVLPETPVTGVHSIYLNSFGGGDPILIDPATYTVSTRRGIVYVRAQGGQWIRGRGAYTVTYSHGYATPLDGSGSGDPTPGSGDDDFAAFPRTLVSLAILVAARFIQQGIVKAESVNGVTVTYSSDDTTLTKGELDIVAKHRANM